MKKASVITILSIVLLGFCVELSGDDVKIAKAWSIKKDNYVGIITFYNDLCSIKCDSLIEYPYSSSYEAFGHVVLTDSDSYTIYSDNIYKDGNMLLTTISGNVVVKYTDYSIYTDSLCIDQMDKYGYFFDGGKLLYKGYSITSDWGEYRFKEGKAYFLLLVSDKKMS